MNINNYLNDLERKRIEYENAIKHHVQHENWKKVTRCEGVVWGLRLAEILVHERRKGYETEL